MGLEKVMDLIEELCCQIPMAEKLLEIKGVGMKTVSGFLAEVGDIRRFDNPKQLQKLAGLALVEDSSGKHKGQTVISRRGRKRLRYLLFEASMPLVCTRAMQNKKQVVLFRIPRNLYIRIECRESP